MAGDTFGAIAEAFVRIRAQKDNTFEQEARDSILPGMTRLAGDVAGLAIGKKLFEVGKAGFDELKQAEQVTAQTEIQLKATGGAAGVTAEHIDKLGMQMLNLAGFDDEAARSAANVLLRFKEIQGTVAFDRVMKDAGDLAITLGTDLPSAARTLGLALQDPEKATRLLRSANVVLDASQKDALKSAVAQGDQAKIQEIILGSLEKQIGGAAKAFGDTLAGSQAKATESMKNAKAELIQGFAPAVQLGADITTKFAQGLSAMPPQLQAVAGGVVFLGGELVSLARPVGDMLRLLDGLRAARAASASAAAAEAAATEVEAGAQASLAASSVAAVGGLEAEAVAAATSSAAFGPLGLAIGAAAALAGGLYLILQDGAGKTVDAKTAIEAYTKALKDNSDEAINSATVSQLAGEGSTKVGQDVAKSFQDAGLSMQVFFDEVRKGSGDLGVLQHNSEIAHLAVKTLADGTTEMVGVHDALRKAADAGSAFAQALLAAHDAGRLSDIQIVAIIQNANTLSGALSDAKQQQGLLATATTDAGDAVGVTAKQLKEQAQALKDNTAAAQDLQATYQSIIDKTLGAFGAGLTEIDAQIASRKALQDLADLPGVQADKLAALARSVSDAEKNVAKAQQSLAAAQAQVGAATTPAQQASALNAVQTATDGLATAQRNLTDAQKKQNDASLTAQQRTDELTTKTNAALKAIIAEAEAHRKNYEATVLATGATVNQTISNQKLVEELVKVRDTLAPDSPLRAALDGYISKLVNDVPKSVVTDLEIRYKETGDIKVLNELITLALSGESGQALDLLGAGFSPTPKAAGGYASAGWVLRGEKGPELTYENMPSFTLPADATAALGNNAPTLNLNFTAMGSPPELADVVLREMQRSVFLQTTKLSRR